MTILDKIVANKLKEVLQRKPLLSVKQLEGSLYFEREPVSLRQKLQQADSTGIIAEIKRQSPSKRIINPHVSIEQLSMGYCQAGASALSVLTDKVFFGGCNEDLEVARKLNPCPILRKDFIIDEYQVIESKSIGADVVLLIAAILPPEKIISLTQLAHSLSMEVLLEVHDERELRENLQSGADFIGVNNRNLKTFEVNADLSFQLISLIPSEFLKISESGIAKPTTVLSLKQAGYHGFLIGQSFMEATRPDEACKSFISELKNLEVHPV